MWKNEECKTGKQPNEFLITTIWMNISIVVFHRSLVFYETQIKTTKKILIKMWDGLIVKCFWVYTVLQFDPT